MRKLLIECLGAFYLTLAAGLSYLMMRNISYAPLTIGGTVLVLTCMAHKISGAHFNPVISLAACIRGNLPLASLPNYILAQFLGASIAFFPVTFLTPNQLIPLGNTNSPQVFVSEFFFTILLCSAFLLFSSAKNNNERSYLGLVVGMTYTISIILVGDISKAVLNPILGFALVVFRAIPTELIPAYLSAHILAALIAGLTVKFLEDKPTI
jgi:glycerol uptake facilitator-like aquaporin